MHYTTRHAIIDPMKLTRCLFVLAGFLLAKTSDAEPLRHTGYELYSWQAGTNWNFAVLEGTGPVRSLSVIRDRKTRLKDTTFLKGRLASLPQGEVIYWREDKARNLLLPPKEIQHELNEFCSTAQLKLLLPGQTKTSKATEEIHSTYDQMTK